MRDAGCAEVLIGFESTSFSGLDGLEQRSNWKARQVDRYLDAVRTIQDHGIRVNGCFILGLDGTGPDSFAAVGRFVQQSGLFDVQITVQTAFPGTPLYERLKSQGRILRDEAWELCTLFDVNFRPAKMSVAELEGGLRTLASQIYSEEATLARRDHFRRNLHGQRRIPQQPHSSVHYKRSIAHASSLDSNRPYLVWCFRWRRWPLSSLPRLLRCSAILTSRHPTTTATSSSPRCCSSFLQSSSSAPLADPVARRDTILYGVALKASYSGLVFWYQAHGGVPSLWIPWAWTDAAFLVLLLLGWFALRPRPAMA